MNKFYPQVCHLKGKDFMIEHTQFCWTPSVEELTVVANLLKSACSSTERYARYFRIKDTTPLVYVREGDVAVGICVTAISSAKETIKALEKLNINVTERS